jgi:hypothetical protein
MGVTIHFKGTLNDPSQQAAILEELSEIAAEIGWSSTEIEHDTPHVKGLVIGPQKKSEPLSFLFDDSGKTRNLTELITNDFEAEPPYSFIKTQFAPIDVHITVIKLLKYLKKKYISDLEVFDEGSYWETEDKKLLQEKIDFLNDKINMIADLLSEIKTDGNETEESIADKIEELLKKKLDK